MRIARGIYRDRFGYRVIWQESGRSREKRFPVDAPLPTLKAYRAEQIRQAQDLAAIDRSGSFVRDVVRYLRQRKGRPSFKSDRAHLRAWVHRFRQVSRWAITAEACATTIAAWGSRGYSPRTIRHRVRVLKELYHALDGSRAPTPLDDLDLPRVPTPRPIAVSDGLVRSVALELLKHERCGWLRTAKTRARFLVDATCGQRPCQHMRAQPFDVDLEKGVWYVRPAKGDRGSVLYLNADMTAAWTLFTTTQAWGRYDRRSYAKTLRRCGWPASVRPYTLRHTVGLTLSELGVDLGDIQAHMGHADLNTTRTFYVPAVPARQQAATQAIDGRLDPIHASLPRPPAKARRTPERKSTEVLSLSRSGAEQGKGRLRDRTSTKSA